MTASRKIKPATHLDVKHVEFAVAHLRRARELLKTAGADKSVERVRSAVKSAEGAERHVRHRLRRTRAEMFVVGRDCQLRVNLNKLPILLEELP